jgi:hypothetical protein
VSESPLQYVLRLLAGDEAPVVLAAELARFPVADVARLLEEGVLKETAAADEIGRPARLGAGGPLLVRRAGGAIYGVAASDNYCKPVRLTDDDVRQYAVSVGALINKLRADNEITDSRQSLDSGLAFVGVKVVAGISLQVHLLLGQPEMDAILGRMTRLESSSGAPVLLTPLALPQRTEHERLFRDGAVQILPLYPFAADGKLTLDWLRHGGQRAVLSQPETRRKRTVGTQEAVAAINSYMAARVLNQAEFSIQAGITEQTLRNFFDTGEMQRSNFKTMAERMGLTPEALLRGELPAGIKTPRRR